MAEQICKILKICWERWLFTGPNASFLRDLMKYWWDQLAVAWTFMNVRWVAEKWSTLSGSIFTCVCAFIYLGTSWLHVLKHRAVPLCSFGSGSPNVQRVLDPKSQNSRQQAEEAVSPAPAPFLGGLSRSKQFSKHMSVEMHKQTGEKRKEKENACAGEETLSPSRIFMRALSSSKTLANNNF